MTKTYKVSLVTKLVAFLDLTVEADSAEDAGRLALADAKKLPHYHFDAQDYDERFEGEPDIEVNEVEDVEAEKERRALLRAEGDRRFREQYGVQRSKTEQIAEMPRTVTIQATDK